MDEPQKVDWTIDDGPKCGDCSFVRNPYGSRLICVRPSDYPCDISAMLARGDGLSKCYDLCGPSGKYFERREFAPDEYDFQNNPPALSAWR